MLGVFFMIVDVSYFPSGKVVETLQILGMYGKRSDGKNRIGSEKKQRKWNPQIQQLR